MDNRLLKVLALVAGLGLALVIGAVAGGGMVYALTRVSDRLPVVRAETADPGHGVVIASVLPDGPAERAGLVRGDILLQIDEQVLDETSDLHGVVGELEGGAEVELTVLHGDDLRVLAVTLEEHDGGAYLGLVPCGCERRAVDVHIGMERGAVILQVVGGSPAESAGLMAGDVILTVDGKGVDSEQPLPDLLADYAPGDTVVIKIERPGQGLEEVTVELGEGPRDAEGTAYLGVVVSPHAHAGSMERFFPYDHWGGGFEAPFVFPRGGSLSGAVIVGVDDDSPASQAGLQAGDVIAELDGRPVEAVEELVAEVGAHEPGDVIALTVLRPGETDELEVKATLGEHPDRPGDTYLGVRLGPFLRMQRRGGEDLPHRMPHFEFPFGEGHRGPEGEGPLQWFRWPHLPEEHMEPLPPLPGESF